MVGNAGLGKALIIIGLANAISVLTSISLSAIATNLKVKVGGPYYIIKDPDKSISPEDKGKPKESSGSKEEKSPDKEDQSN